MQRKLRQLKMLNNCFLGRITFSKLRVGGDYDQVIKGCILIPIWSSRLNTGLKDYPSSDFYVLYFDFPLITLFFNHMSLLHKSTKDSSSPFATDLLNTTNDNNNHIQARTKVPLSKTSWSLENVVESSPRNMGSSETLVFLGAFANTVSQTGTHQLSGRQGNWCEAL